MASMGWAEACPNGKRDQGVALSQRGIFREGCAFPTAMRDQAPPIFQETMMRFYTSQHRFYCGIDERWLSRYVFLFPVPRGEQPCLLSTIAAPEHSYAWRTCWNSSGTSRARGKASTGVVRARCTVHAPPPAARSPPTWVRTCFTVFVAPAATRWTFGPH